MIKIEAKKVDKRFQSIRNVKDLYCKRILVTERNVSDIIRFLRYYVLAIKKLQDSVKPRILVLVTTINILKHVRDLIFVLGVKVAKMHNFHYEAKQHISVNQDKLHLTTEVEHVIVSVILSTHYDEHVHKVVLPI